jgi:pyrrolidone-carboxylate peptidase
MMHGRVPASRREPAGGQLLQRKSSLRIGKADDAHEREADRMADAVTTGSGLRRSLSAFSVRPKIQRDNGGKPKSEGEKYKEAAKKLGEAFLKTAPGKEIKEKAEKLGDAFISTLPGKIITGSAIAGAVATLAATHKELPIGIPEIPLDKIKPGLKLKITYEGPVDKPTKVMASFSFPLGVPKTESKPKMTKAERYRAETARMAKELYEFREMLKTPEQRAEEQRMMDSWLMSRIHIPGRASSGARDLPKPLAPYASEFRVSGEQPKTKEPEKKKEEETLQRKPATTSATPKDAPAPSIVSDVLHASGRPLESGIRSYMESQFGHDLKHVRVHTDSQAAQSAQAVDAHAYTVGRDIVFAQGNYSPSSPAGRHLLAHELTHVIQQTHNAPASGPIIQRKGGTFGGFFRNIGRGIASIFADEPDYSEIDLQQYLTLLDTSNDIEDDYDSDNKARAVVSRWRQGNQSYILTTRLKVLLIQEMLSGPTLGDDENAILALLQGSNDREIGVILEQADEAKLRSDINDDQGETLERIISAWRRRRDTHTARTGSMPGSQAQGGDTGIAARLMTYLRYIDVNDRIQRGPDSHILAREIVSHWSAGDERYYLPPRRKQLLIRELLTDAAFEQDIESVMTLLKGAEDGEIRLIKSEPGESWIRSHMGDSQHATFDQFMQDWRTRQTLASANHSPSDKIERIVVDQEIPQTVTLHWRSGATDSDICSTGKGHCCVDENDAQGAACSEKESTQSGSNCTPVGKHPVAFKIPRPNSGVEWWTEFYNSRDIALHTYSRVDGTPLSHGCVRLHEPMAKKIYHGVIATGASAKRTQVEVKGLARPRCNWPALQTEWAGDLRTAGSEVDDGEPTNVQQQQRDRINKQRATEREIFNIDDAALTQQIENLQQQTGGIPSAGSIWGSHSHRVSTLGRIGPITDIIPRCVATQTVEERRLTTSNTPALILKQNKFNAFATPFQKALKKSKNFSAAEKAVRLHAQALWQAAVARAQSQPANTDDRPLYWARLQMFQVLREWTPGWSRTHPGRQRIGTIDDIRRDKNRLLALFETASRGMESAAFDSQQGDKHILISGFDPYGLHQNIDRGNPSGAAVLSLDNRTLAQDGINAQVQGVIFPVRFPDFDAGIVERFFTPYINNLNPPDMIMTISQGVSQAFEIEQYAGRRRSSGYPGNLGLTGGGTKLHPIEAPGLAAGPEFLESTLPVKELRSSLGRTEPLPEETEFMEIREGENRPVSSGNQRTPEGRAVRGSGGGYLSNEIFYRTSLLRHSSNKNIPVGHLHTPYLPPPSHVGDFQAQRDAIVSRVEQILKAAIPHI